MASNEGEKLHRLEDLKTKLFSKGFQSKIEHHDGFMFRQKKDVPDFWKKEETEEEEIAQASILLDDDELVPVKEEVVDSTDEIAEEEADTDPSEEQIAAAEIE